jgi:hypothetical protein
MRVAVIVVTVLAVTTPSEASQSCMSKAEARQHFGAVHIYWHGPDHCWDATGARHRQIQVRHKPPIQEVQRQSEPQWHGAMSAMLPNDGVVRSLTIPAPSGIEHQGDDPAMEASWIDRWVDIGPSQSLLVARRVRVVQIPAPPVSELKSVLMISTHDMLVLAFIAFVLSLGTVGVLYRHDL